MRTLKNLIYLLICASIVTFTACDDDEKIIPTYEVGVQLVYPEGSNFQPAADVPVTMTNANSYVFTSLTDDNGIATFKLPVGLYQAAASEKRAADGATHLFNGTKSNISIASTWDASAKIELELSQSTTSQVIIKELYVGGCLKDDGKSFIHDRYVILYNNSDQVATLENLCLGMVLPYNSHSTNSDYVGGKLFYEAEGWIPAGQAFWYYPETMTIEPYSQKVIALFNAIDNTKLYSNSINFANSEYYCTYDPLVFTNATFYVAPAAEIPTSNYFKAYFYGLGNAWTLSNLGPAFYVFTTKGSTPKAFAEDTGNLSYHGGGSSASQCRKKVPVEWIIDGVEVFKAGEGDKNSKRLTASVDGGYVYLTGGNAGYTSYRNVDKEATEAIADNTGKLVYNYSLGTEIDGMASTDPTNIDAEASIKLGAKIVYKDTNNSSNDFHQRAKASLKD